VLDQIDKIREDVAAKEDALKQARRQLTKLEEVRKVLESN
jgi:acetolactate synthase small subunit